MSVALAGEVGLDESSFASCVGSRTALERVVEDLYDTSGTCGSTPTFVVLSDGRPSMINVAQSTEQFAVAFDDLLAE